MIIRQSFRYSRTKNRIRYHQAENGEI